MICIYFHPLEIVAINKFEWVKIDCVIVSFYGLVFNDLGLIYPECSSRIYI